MNELLKGWNKFASFTEFNKFIDKDKWSIKDLKYFKLLITNGCKPAIDVIFITWNNHPSYIKFFGTDITPPPKFSFKEVQEMTKGGKP